MNQSQYRDLFGKYEFITISFAPQKDTQQLVGAHTIDERNISALFELLEHHEEVLVLQKCNCVEYYLVTRDENPIQSITEALSQLIDSFDSSVFEKHAVVKKSTPAIQHLFETSIGLRSVVLGDTQVYGQLMNAFATARNQGASGIYLEAMAGTIKKLHKDVLSQTEFTNGNTSIERVLSKIIERDLGKKEAIYLFGAGMSGQLIAKALDEEGFTDITIITRDPSRAKNKLPSKYTITNDTQKLEIPNALIFASNNQELLESTFLKANKVYDISTTPLINSDNLNGQHISIQEVREEAKKILQKRENETNAVKSRLGQTLRKHLPPSIENSIIDQTIRDNLQALENMQTNADTNHVLLRSKLLQVVRTCLSSHKFIEVNTPLITMIPMEFNNQNEVFSVELHGGKPAYLKTSSQFYMNALISNTVSRLFEVTPSWRKPAQLSSNELLEFWTINMEMKATEVQDPIDITVEMLDQVNTIVQRSSDKLTSFDSIVQLKWSSIPETIKQATTFDTDVQQLSDYVRKKHDKKTYIVANCPERYFYDNPNSRFYIIHNNMVIGSGGSRDTDKRSISKKIKNSFRSANRLEQYVSFIKNNISVNHCGLSIGVERLIASLINTTNVADATLFPRTSTKLIP